MTSQCKMGMPCPEEGTAQESVKLLIDSCSLTVDRDQAALPSAQGVPNLDSDLVGGWRVNRQAHAAILPLLGKEGLLPSRSTSLLLRHCFAHEVSNVLSGKKGHCKR